MQYSIHGLLAGSVVLLVVYYVHWQLTVGAKRRAIIREHGCEPMVWQKFKVPFIALDRFFAFQKAFKEKRLLSLVQWQFTEAGRNTYTTIALGARRSFTCEPENIKHILSTDFKNWGLPWERLNAVLPFLGPGIFVNNGGEWQHSREMLRPSFARTNVRDLDSLDTHVEHLLAAIPRDGSTVDMQDLFFRLTIDSATAFLFGESTNTLAPGLATISATKFAECFNRAQDHCFKRIVYGGMPWLAPGAREFKGDVKYVHDFVDTHVERGMAMRPRLLEQKPDEQGRYVFLEELVRQTTDRSFIRSECLNILLAGRDTTSSLLNNAFWSISRRPDIWAKLREEVDQFHGEKPTFDQIREMKYVRAVLSESLRLYPAVPINSRESLHDTILPRGGGKDGRSPCFMPKGSVVGYSVYAMMRRKDLYGDDAEEFKPERWLGEKGIRPGWEYLPFNGGPRICLGQQFALIEASYVTIRIIQEFKDIHQRDFEPWTEKVNLTTVGSNCNVAFTPFSNA